MNWPYAHGTAGTCDDEACPSFGRCHTCGEPTRLAPQNHAAKGFTKGRPFVHHQGHTPRRPGSRAVALSWQRRGAPLDKMLPLVRWLLDRYSQAELERRLDMAQGTICHWFDPGRKWIPRDRAQRLTELVLAHRPARTSAFDTHGADVQRRLPSQWESERAQREATAEYRAWCRAGGSRTGRPAPNLLYLIEDNRSQGRRSA